MDSEKKTPPMYIPRNGSLAQVCLIQKQGFPYPELILNAPEWSEDEFWLPLMTQDSSLPAMFLLLRRERNGDFRVADCRSWSHVPRAEQEVTDTVKRLCQEFEAAMKSALADELSDRVLCREEPQTSDD
uniref:Uncharacterized protein n=1 Tax=Marinobacter nauticus TaxID=2743 RepID=A0A455W6W1_MARNT|nr:hypothetical protein YBY_30180 [Marinobacter nauticus]